MGGIVHIIDGLGNYDGSSIFDLSGNGTTSTTAAIPSAVRPGDLMLLFVTCRGTATAPTVSDNGSGSAWTMEANAVNGTNGLSLWYKYAVGNSRTKTITVSNGSANSMTCVGIGVRGAKRSNPISVLSTEANASGNVSHASITPTTDYGMFFLGIGSFGSAQGASNLSCVNFGGMSDQAATSTGGSDCGVVIGSSSLPTAGATGQFDWSQPTAQISSSIAFAVYPENYTGARQSPTLIESLQNSTTNGTAPSVTFTSGGMQAGDVIVWMAAAGDDTASSSSIIADYMWADANYGSSEYSLYARIVAEPVTDFNVVTGLDPSSTTAGATLIAKLFRGIDLDSLYDNIEIAPFNAYSDATGSSTNPDPPAVTPAAQPALVIAGAASQVSDAAITVPANYSFGTVGQSNANASGTDASSAMAHRVVTSTSAENPAAFGSWVTGSWRAFTIYLLGEQQPAAKIREPIVRPLAAQQRANLY